jgi:nucleotide-binding universal stress UspA family protein
MRMTRILLAIDDSSARLATDAIIRQYVPHVTHVHVLHVVSDRDRLPAALSFAEGSTASRDVLLFDRSVRLRGEALIAEVVGRLSAAGFQTSSEQRPGDAGRAILDRAASTHPDIIVIGSHRRHGIDRLIDGSVSATVLRRAPCPVEVVPCSAESVVG